MGNACLFQFERTGVELIIGALLGEQLFVVAAFDDVSMIQYHDDIAVADSGKPVSDDKDSTSIHQAVHTLLYNGLVRVSMEEVASSRIITGGSATAARAMDSSCRWPWERLVPPPVRTVS